MGIIEFVADSASATRKVMSIARSSPDLFARCVPSDALKITVLISFISGAILLVDRWMLQPHPINDAKAAVAAVIVIGIVMAVSLAFIIITSVIFPLFTADGEDAERLANSWGLMFGFVWFLSAVFCLIDLIIKVIAGAGSGPLFAVLLLIGDGHNVGGLRGDRLLPCVGYAVLAYLVLFLRTYICDHRLVTFGRAMMSFWILVPVVSLMMYVALWAPFEDLVVKMLHAQ